MQHRFRVLVVDDEPDVLTLLRAILMVEGFEVITARDGHAALRMAYSEHPDAILLDVMMPDMNGFEACRLLREMTDVPIIFVTARANIEDIVHGLSLGADDYVTKPFERPELISRLVTCLRRAGGRTGDTENNGDYLFPGGQVVLDCDRHELIIANRTVYLTPKEFEILRLLVRHSGKVFSADAILTRVWGPHWVGEQNLVKQYVYRLRRKIEPDPGDPRYLHTVRGGGYYFDASGLA